jgi:hypothetical protein
MIIMTADFNAAQKKEKKDKDSKMRSAAGREGPWIPRNV